MLFESPIDAAFAATISRLLYCNPFLPERIEFEREALGADFVEGDVVWNVTQDWEGNRPNIAKLRERVERAATGGAGATGRGRHGVVRRIARSTGTWSSTCFTTASTSRSSGRWRGRWPSRSKNWRRCTSGSVRRSSRSSASRGSSRRRSTSRSTCSRSTSRSGGRSTTSSTTSSAGRCPPPGCGRPCGSRSSPTTCAATAASCYDRMGDFTTLITGPSGTGKELVARAIAMARYIPFDAKSKTFAGDFYAVVHRAEPVGPVAHADRVRVVRPPPRGVHRGAGGPGRLAGNLPAAGDGLPRRDRRAGPGHPGEAAPRAPDAAASSGSETPRPASSAGRSSPPPTATWPAEMSPRGLP